MDFQCLEGANWENVNNMESQKVIRYGVLSFGIISVLITIMNNIGIGKAMLDVTVAATYGFDVLLLIFFLVLLAFYIAPYFYYFYATKEIHSLVRLLIPAILLCSVYLVFYSLLLKGATSIPEPDMIPVPVLGGIAVAFGLFLGSFIEKIKSKLINK